MKARFQLEEDTLLNDLGIAVVLCLIPFIIWAAYHIAPEATLVLMIAGPVAVVFARWLKIWTNREQADAPGPFDDSL